MKATYCIKPVCVDGETMTLNQAVDKFSKLGNLKAKTVYQRLITRPDCDSAWLTREACRGVSDPATIKKCRVNGVEMKQGDAYRLYAPAGFDRPTFLRRLDRLPYCTAEELALPSDEFRKIVSRRNPVPQDKREERTARRKLPSGKIDVDGSVLTIDQAALYIARMTAKADVTLCKIGKRIETFLTGRHYGSRYDIGTFRRATPEMIRAEIV